MYNVLMVGVDSRRVGGMWAVAETYIEDKRYNQEVELTYIPTITAGSARKRFLCMVKGYGKVLKALRREQIDIVHIHMAERGSTFRKGFIARWGKKSGKKVIIHLHAGSFMEWYSAQKSGKQKMIRRIFQYGDKICVLGEYWKEELTEIVDRGKIEVLYNGVECPSGNPYNKNSKNIVYLGVICRTKGVYDLIDGIERICQKLDEGVTVQLWGKDLEGKAEQIIREKHLGKYITMMGWADEETKEKIFADTMLLVLPSYFEGLSVSVIEAMAHGIPVVTTDISTMPELLGRKDKLVKPGDSVRLGEYILELVNDVSERNRMSMDEFGRVKMLFSKERFVDRTLEIYKECSVC